ncbi:hypothetical protein MSAS_56230 [Mycobacterium saskatchewanense]|uniref:VOC family protein n=1 Tax=Mycobacterium saskatchewanense TaxID=220927 RepID=UPI00138B2E98|nr:VOC family protein [Mycobacterium saskatchewanense]BBX66449.1 hypothetical protein MSAS_56230 [Mycobacterium saskatchewanense]
MKPSICNEPSSPECLEPGRPGTGGGAAFSHVAVTVTNLERSLAFYRDGLALVEGTTYEAAGRSLAALMNIAPTGFRGVFLRAGHGYIELLEYRTPTQSNTGTRHPDAVGYAHISLLVADVDPVLSAVVEHGGAVLARLRHSFGGVEDSDIAFVADPDGNRVELIAHPHVPEARAHARFLGVDQLDWPPT